MEHTNINYIQQINGFWDKCEQDNLDSNVISTYFALLQYCNWLGWKNPFICHYDRVCQYASISKNTFYKNMDLLNELKYLEFHKGLKNSTKPKVFILPFKNRKGTELRTKLRTEREQNEEQKGNLYKLLNTETIKLINNNASLVNDCLHEWIKMHEQQGIAPDEKEVLFDRFWDRYGKKDGKADAKKKFIKLKKSEIDKIFETLDSYLLRSPDLKYRKNAATYINQRVWEDEVNEPPKVFNNDFIPTIDVAEQTKIQMRVNRGEVLPEELIAKIKANKMDFLLTPNI